MLDHLIHDLTRRGYASYMMADFYEISHKRFKDAYRKNFKRLYSAMNETLKLQYTWHKVPFLECT